MRSTTTDSALHEHLSKREDEMRRDACEVRFNVSKIPTSVSVRWTVSDFALRVV